MPEAVAEHVGGPGIELDDDFVVAVAFEHGEAAAEVVVEVELAVGFEFIADEDGAADSAKDEGAEVRAGEVEGDEVPEVFVAGEVIGLDGAEGGGFFAGFAVLEAEGAMVAQGAGDGFEAFEVEDFGREGAEGEDGVEVLE